MPRKRDPNATHTAQRRNPPNVFYLEDEKERELCSTCTLAECVEDTGVRGAARMGCNIVKEGLRQRAARQQASRDHKVKIDFYPRGQLA